MPKQFEINLYLLGRPIDIYVSSLDDAKTVARLLSEVLPFPVHVRRIGALGKCVSYSKGEML